MNSIFKNIITINKDKLLLCSLALFFFVNKATSQEKYPDIVIAKGKISQTSDALGNQIPDFSYAGYQASEKAIPNVDNKIFVPVQKGDATQKIQAAIDYVSNLKANKSGFRGAVLLDKGTFNVSGTLYIRTSGVVLRGSGNSENGTVLLGTGIKRESVIRVLGIGNE